MGTSTTDESAMSPSRWKRTMLRDSSSTPAESITKVIYASGSTQYMHDPSPGWPNVPDEFNVPK